MDQIEIFEDDLFHLVERLDALSPLQYERIRILGTMLGIPLLEEDNVDMVEVWMQKSSNPTSIRKIVLLSDNVMILETTITLQHRQY